MKALVLGATGFLGHHLVFELLKKKWDVRILKRPNTPLRLLPESEIEISVGDLNDRASLETAMKACDVVFHTAGYYPIYSLGRKNQIKIALNQTENVLLACEKTDIKKLIFTSSVGTLAKVPDSEEPSAEENRLRLENAGSTYHQIKILMEQKIEAWAKKGRYAVIMIPGGMIGPYDVKPTTGRVVLEMMKKKLPAYVDGEMSWVDVRDVARAEITAAEKAGPGERFVLGNWNTNTKDFLDILAEIAQVPRPKIKIPISIAYFFAYCSEIFGKYLLHQKAPVLPLVSLDLIRYGVHLNSDKARKQLYFNPGPISVAIKDTIDWFRENGYASGAE
ncbi:3 beta-hydroxysteroid dehydrogenase/Delta 5--_4-isomerase [bacterium BMS3Abin05]|nr:3 beta-hydroxysteroid dehydrogenase/Delta 5-->4-isomerase [bacterium BMS3Abin05]